MAALLPTFTDPLEDPIYLIPPIGRHYSSHDAFELGADTPSSLTPRGSRPPVPVPMGKDRVSELKAQAAAEVTSPCCISPHAMSAPPLGAGQKG